VHPFLKGYLIDTFYKQKRIAGHDCVDDTIVTVPAMSTVNIRIPDI
jgi:hypothetical protein